MADRVETRGVDSNRAGGAGWGLPAGLILFALVLLLVLARVQPPDPKPQDAPAEEFSAGRAGQVLATLLGDGRPHPIGTPANAAVRDRVVAELRRLGYTPQVQSDLSCVPFGCAQVDNVLARLEGREQGPAVLLMAHYDSVGASAGASDDMAGVAALLEVARILKAGPAPRNPVLFLFDDGEEAGLMGARAFVQRPESRDVAVVVNLEARGSSGPSLMFETSGQNGWTVPLYAREAGHPLASSVFATIYDYLPNDTDLSVFKERKVHGLNFAYIGSPTRYHTSQDNLENASPASLQHHGDNALAAVRGLAEADLSSPPAGNAVFFDVLGWVVVHWPAGWTVVLAILALLLVIVATVLGLRSRVLSGGGVAFGILGFLGMVVAAGVVAFVLVRGLFAGLLMANWVAHPAPLLAVFWLLPLAVVLMVAGLLFRRAGLSGTWAGVWIAWAVVALVLAFLAPGLSYLFLVPALMAGLAGLVAFGRPGGAGGVVASLLPGLVMALLWFPLISFLYDGLGTGGLIPIGVLVALAATTLAPLAAGSGPGLRRWVPIAVAVLAVIFVFMAVSRAPFSESSPQGISLQYHLDADSGQARWLLRGFPPLPRAVLEAARFDREPKPAYPWSPAWSRVVTAAAPALATPGPEVTVLEDAVQNGKRRLRVRVASPRQAPVLNFIIPRVAGVESIRVGDVEVPTQAGPPGGDWYNFSHLTLPAGGAEMTFVLASTAKHDWYLVDQSYGLPPAGAPLQKARPAASVPFQDGDITLVSRKLNL